MNDVPTAIGLSATVVVENASGAIVGDLTTTDADVGDSHNYTVTDDRFEVVNNQLKLKDGISLNHETTPTVDVTVTTTDLANAPHSQLFSIAVTDIAEVAVITGEASGNVAEDDSASLLTATGVLNIADEDVGEANFVAETVSGTYGSLVIDVDGNWSYTADNTQDAIQQLGDGEQLIDTMTVTTADGTTKNVEVTILGTNDAPVVTEAVTASTAEDTPITLTKAQLLEKATDIEGDNLEVSNIQVNAGSISITDNNNGTWSFTPDAHWSGSAIVSFDVNDGTETTPTQLNLTIDPVTDAPILSVTSDTVVSVLNFEGDVLADGWTSEAGTEISKMGTIAAYDSNPHEGEYAAELDVGRAHDALYYSVDTNQGHDHKVSIWVKERTGSDGTDHVEIVWNGEVLQTIDPTTTWGEFVVTLPDTNQDTTQLAIREVSEQNQGTGALIDFIKIIKLGVSVSTDPTYDYVLESNEDSLIALDIAATLADIDGSENISNISLAGIPPGFTITGGANILTTDGSDIDIKDWATNDITLTPSANYNGDVPVTLSATTTESDGSTATVNKTLLLEINPVNDAPEFDAPELADTAFLDSIQAAYSFDEGTGDALNKAGESNNITLTGSATYGTGHTGTGTAFEMNGTSGAGEISGITTGGVMSISTWVKFDSLDQNWSRVFDFGNGAGNNNILLGHVGTGSTLGFEVVNNPGTTTNGKLHISNFFTAGEWVHVTATIDATGLMSIYKNGELAGSNQGVVPDESVRTHNYIGKSNWNDGALDGSIDEFIIYNKALTAEEIHNVYQTTTVDELLQNTLFIDENSTDGTVVATMQATDVDNNNLEYSLTNDAGGRFAIDSVTGKVTVANGSLLDFETVDSHTVTVQVSDGGLTSSKDYNINLKNVDVEGTAAEDTLTGTADSDYMKGMAANDSLDGAEGDDVLSGGAGDDILTGGTGSDHFIWHADDLGSVATPADDTIIDFQTGQGGDVLELEGILQDTENHSLDEYLHLHFADGNTTIDIAHVASGDITQKITLQGVDLSSYGGGTTDAEIINNLLNDGNLDIH